MSLSHLGEATLPRTAIVVDDVWEEASPLISALYKKGIPVLYFTGNLDELPETPTNGVRLVFLDMQLAGMAGQDPKTVSSKLMNILRRIISTRNGPYLIVAWTEHNDILEAFTSELAKQGKDAAKPCFIVNLNKPDCYVDKILDEEKVTSKLNTKLEELGEFSFLLYWENIVGQSSSDAIDLISSMVEGSDEKEWKAETARLLYGLAKLQSEKALIDEPTIITRSTIRTLNSILKDCIEEYVECEDEGYLKRPGNTQIQPEKQAILHTKIHLRKLQPSKGKILPGYLYLYNDHKVLRKHIVNIPEDSLTFKREFFKSSVESNEEHKKLLGQSRFCLLEMTPMCDYTQNKWRSIRLLAGLLVPVDLKESIKHSDSIYQSPVFNIDDEEYHIVFNAFFTSSSAFDGVSELEPLYQLRLDILAHIQSWFSNHISRIGILKFS